MKPAFFIILGAMLLAACSGTQQEEQTLLNNQKILDYLVSSYGFLKEDITETDDTFIAEGDQVFPKEGFWENYGTDSPNGLNFMETGNTAVERKHYRASYLVTQSEIITLNVKPGVPYYWEQAIENAAAAWNDLYGGLYFDVVYSNTSNDKSGAVNISMNAALEPNTGAEALLPSSNGYPGKRMEINPKYNNSTLSWKTFVIAHEIGHAIGFRHTDRGLGTLITDVNSSCRTKTDPSSLMRASFKDTDLFMGFTSCDVEAYDALYLY